jgi:hypothetical protein
MSTQPESDPAVNRLLDMVVEEVSLVDRAANNRKFLIVKRDHNMNEDTDIEKADGDSPPAEDGSEGLGGGSPLGAAIAALESLTSIVEALGSLGANRADTRLAELARELRDTADQILSQVGEGGEEQPAGDGVPSTDDALNAAEDMPPIESRAKAKASGAKKPPFGKKPTGKKPGKKKPVEPDEEDDETADDEEDDETDDNFAQAKAALGKLTEALGGMGRPVNKASSKAPTTEGNTAELTTTVTKLTETVQALTETVQGFQQRLGRVEKHSGVPNSAPPAEHVAKTVEAAVGWPLDLNHPMDRQSVDKAVSFHDL